MDNKYISKPVEIEASVFQWGMEDGILRYNEYIPKDAERYPEEMRMSDTGYLYKYEDEFKQRGFNQDENWIPYILSSDGAKVLVEEDDYIITNSKGERYTCKPDYLNSNYDKKQKPSDHV